MDQARQHEIVVPIVRGVLASLERDGKSECGYSHHQFREHYLNLWNCLIVCFLFCLSRSSTYWTRWFRTAQYILRNARNKGQIEDFSHTGLKN